MNVAISTIASDIGTTVIGMQTATTLFTLIRPHSEDFEIAGTVVIPEGGVSPVWVSVAIGALIPLWFCRHLKARERKGRDPRCWRPACSTTASPTGALAPNSSIG